VIGLSTKWSSFVDRQHRYPSGLVGRVIGERMLRQHAPETEWSVELLRLQPADRVLEIGFGAGRGLALTLQRTLEGHVTGMDLSATMIRAASRRNRGALAGRRLTLLRGDITRLPFDKGSFDKIFTIHTFYFWPEPGEICRRLVGLLARGGRLVSTFATAQTLPNGERRYWPVHQLAQTLVEEYGQYPGTTATLAHGPDSRQFNNVAIVIDKGGI
jgi:SAM-dependent methyltransferase